MTAKDEPRRLALICPECDNPSSAYVHGFLDKEADVDGGWPVSARLYLTQCEHCGEPALVMQDDFGIVGPEPPFVLWPSKQRLLSPAIPDALRAELEEARSCFKAKAYRATAVMVRRTLEGFCQDQGVSERSLHESLRKLHAAGLIDGRLFEWAQGLRALGNAGAHAGGTVDPQDAQDALELAEALLDYVYVFSARFAEFQKRRSTTRSAELRDRHYELLTGSP